MHPLVPRIVSRNVPALLILLALGGTPVLAQNPPPAADTAFDPVREMVARLDLERYKATVKGLTRFGDRRQGTDRNRAALDWIEAQLKSYGCTNTERLTYEFPPSGPAARPAPRPAPNPQVAAGGGRPRGVRARTRVINDALAQPDAALR